jgi:MtaA/CmuA family methyltransferase
MNSKERLYAALRGEPYDRPPVTPIFMAWAAHFAGHTYRDYYLDGNVLVRSQLAVVHAFNLDQISAISDPWREAADFGMAFDYPEEGVGKPRAPLIQTAEDVTSLKPVSIENSRRMLQRVKSVQTMASAIGQTHSVLGWIEGPFAEYADLRGVEQSLMDLIDRPELFLAAGEIIVQNAIQFAIAQVQAGADMIGMGDAAASLIGPDLYEHYVLPFEQHIIHAVHEAGATVKLHICGNINSILSIMGRTGADIIDIDWMVPLDKAREKIGPTTALCGNVDPTGVLLQGTPEQAAQAARECLRQGGLRFILMPGCEVPQGTPIDNIRAFCAVCHEKQSA